MACKDILNFVQSEHIHSTAMHVDSSSHFELPEGWIVEERPRRSKPSHVDRYYYEPYTRKQFRSLSSVRKYLAKEAGDQPDITAKMISEDTNTNTNSTESGEGQQLEEDASTAIPKWAMKSDTGEKKVRGKRSCRKRAYKPSSVAQEEIIIPKSCKHSIESAVKKPVKLDNQKKETNSEKNNRTRTPVHNLIEPPPKKVTWVLSGPGGFWNPFVNGVAVTEAERLKWSEAFVLSLRGNRNQGLDEDVL